MAIIEKTNNMGRLKLTLGQMSELLKTRVMQEVSDATGINRTTLTQIRHALKVDGDTITIRQLNGGTREITISDDVQKRLNEFLTTLQ
jgi:hypothetical protein